MLLKLLRLFLIAALCCGAAGSMADSPRATKEECVAFVKKAVAYFKTNGAKKALTEFSNPNGTFIDRDLYINVYNAEGVCLAHGLYPRLIGRNRLDEQDAEGRYYVRARVNRMKNEEQFWVSYKFPDPLTHKIISKQTYCETVRDQSDQKLMICSGVYDAPASAEPPVTAARATREECVAFVKRAVEEIRLKGAAKAFAGFNDKKGGFIDRDLYVIAYDMRGMTMAHGENPVLVGHNRLDEQDADGVYYNRERFERMKTQSSF